MIRELVVFLALTSVALAAVSIASLEPKPEKFKDVEGCYIGELDAVIPLYETSPSKTSCSSYRCRANDVSIETCGAVQVLPDCELEEHVAKPHPYCCPTVVCR